MRSDRLGTVSEQSNTTGDEAKSGFRHVRLVIALAVASLLGTFAVYTALADSAMPVVAVAKAADFKGERIRLEGKVTQTDGDAADAGGLRFTLRDYEGPQTVEVVYRGSVPDAYRVGRDVVIDGTMTDGVLQAVPDTLVTKCPSKYQDKATAPSGTS